VKRLLAGCLILLLSITSLPLNLASNSQTSSLQPAYVRVDSNLIYIGNSFIELQFQKTNGGIYSIINKLTGEDYRSDKGSPAELFQYEVSGTVNSWYKSDGPSSFSYNYSVTASSASLNLVDSFSLYNYPTTATASVVVYTNSSLSHWRMSVDNPGSVPIDKVDFPLIYGAKSIGTDPTANYILLPDSFGSMLHDPYDALLSPSSTGCCFVSADYPSWSTTTQMMIYGDNSGGLYLATYDTQGGAKSFGATRVTVGSDTFMQIFIEHDFPETPGAVFRIPYDTIVGVFSGDWQDAADIYRSWAQGQWWTARGPLSTRTDMPQWFKDGFADLNLFSYLSTDDYSTPTEELNFSQTVSDVQAYLQQVPSPLLFEWSGWEKYGSWVSPNVFPPYEGWAAFDAAVSQLHSMGVHVVISLTDDLIFTDSPGVNQSWVNCAVRQWNGSIYYYHEGNGQQAIVASPACTAYQDLLIQNVVNLEEHGVDGVRLDADWDMSPCDYSSVNGHPVGCGSWFAQDDIQFFQNLANAVHAINPQFLLGVEHLPEIYIPFFPMYLDDAGQVGSDPFVQQFGSRVSLTNLFYYIYNDYSRGWSRELHVDGGPSSYQGYGAYYDYVQADGSTGGQTVDFADTSWPDQYPLVTNLTRSIAWATSGFASDFLTTGRSLVPPPIESPPLSLTMDQFSTPWNSPKLFNYSIPSVLDGAWQSPDGRVGLLFINLGTSTLEASLDITSYYTSFVGTGELLAITSDENGLTSLNVGSGGANLTLTLPPQQALALQIAQPSALPSITSKYDAFLLAYVGERVVGRASTTGINLGSARTTMLAAENAYTSHSYSRSISTALQALNATARAFTRFGQLLSGGQTYAGYLTAFNAAVKQGNYEAAFDAVESAIGIGEASTSPLFRGVLFDQTHTDTAVMTYLKSTPWYSYDLLDQILESQGWSFVPESGPLTSAALANQSVAILPMPDKPFSQSEISAYLNFVKAGGGLIILGAWDTPQSTNALTDNFGIHFLGSTVTSTSYIGDKHDFNVTNFRQSNPVTAGVKWVITNYMAAVSVSPGVDVLAWTESNSNSSTASGPFPFVAITTYGAGRVLLIADHLFDDTTVQGMYTGTLFSNSMAWASQPKAMGNTLLIVGSYEQSQRVNVGSSQAASFRLVRADDGSYPAGATIAMGNYSAVVSSLGWANFTVSQITPQKNTYIPSGGTTSNGSLRLLMAGGSPVGIIWDEVVISLNVASTETTVGTNATITWTGYYEYDHAPFSGTIVLNDTTVKDAPGVYTYTVSKIIGSKYSLTAFTSNRVTVDFVSSQQSTTTTSVGTTSSSQSTASSSGASGIPEFPYQLLALVVVTVVIAVSFVFSRRRTARAPT